MQIVSNLITTACFLSQGSQAKKVYQSLTSRECEYLEYIRKESISVYGKLIRKLKEEKVGTYGFGHEPYHGVPKPFKQWYDQNSLLLDNVAK